MRNLRLHGSLTKFGLQSSWPSAQPVVVLKNFGIDFSPQLLGLNLLDSLPLDHCLNSYDLILFESANGSVRWFRSLSNSRGNNQAKIKCCQRESRL